MNKTQTLKKNINLTPNCEGSSSIMLFFVTNLSRFLTHSFNIIFSRILFSFDYCFLNVFLRQKTTHTHKNRDGIKIGFILH